jgi:prolyl 4-hydroxylase
MVMYWVPPDGAPAHAGTVGGDGAQTGFHCYGGHVFFWAEEDADPPVPTTYPGATGAEIYITDSVRLYYYYDDSTKKAVMDDLEDELDFAAKYRADHGIHWVGTTWPRPPPVHDFINTTGMAIGDTFDVDTSADPRAGQYTCSSDDVKDCVSGKKVNRKVTKTNLPKLEIEIISLTPKVFRVLNFLSEFEADYIINQAIPMLHRSTVGDGDNIKVDTTRTSRSAWIAKTHSEVIDAIYQRMGHATHFPLDEMGDSNVESLNILNYPVKAEYTPHYDWGADGQIESRFLSGLIYLNEPEAGGGTSFPLAKMPNGKQGTSVDPIKRSAVFFYDLLPDGNADELSLHAGMPVLKGEKWIAPMWIWDPSRYKGTYLNKVKLPVRETPRPPKRYRGDDEGDV